MARVRQKLPRVKKKILRVGSGPSKNCSCWVRLGKSSLGRVKSHVWFWPNPSLIWVNEPPRHEKITKMKIFESALLEIPASVQSSFCPNSAEFSACVSPALQKGWSKYFYFDEFAHLLCSVTLLIYFVHLLCSFTLLIYFAHLLCSFPLLISFAHLLKSTIFNIAGSFYLLRSSFQWGVMPFVSNPSFYREIIIWSPREAVEHSEVNFW